MMKPVSGWNDGILPSVNIKSNLGRDLNICHLRPSDYYRHVWVHASDSAADHKCERLQPDLVRWMKQIMTISCLARCIIFCDNVVFQWRKNCIAVLPLVRPRRWMPAHIVGVRISCCGFRRTASPELADQSFQRSSRMAAIRFECWWWRKAVYRFTRVLHTCGEICTGSTTSVGENTKTRRKFWRISVSFFPLLVNIRSWTHMISRDSIELSSWGKRAHISQHCLYPMCEQYTRYTKYGCSRKCLRIYSNGVKIENARAHDEHTSVIDLSELFFSRYQCLTLS